MLFDTNNGRLITQWLIGVGIKMFSDKDGRLGPGIDAQFAYGGPNPFINGMR